MIKINSMEDLNKNLDKLPVGAINDKESTFNTFKQRQYSKDELKNLEEKLLGYQP